MSRYISEFQTNIPAQYTFDAFSQYLTAEGYEFTNYHQESVFKKGKGLMTAPTFIKLVISDDLVVRMEAWIKFALLPGVYIGEMNLDGAFGFAMKKVLKERVLYLENMMLQAGAVPLAAQPAFVSGVIGTQPMRLLPQGAPQQTMQQPYAQPQQAAPQNMPYAQQPQQAAPQNMPYAQPPQQAAPQNTPYVQQPQQANAPQTMPYAQQPQQAAPQNMPYVQQPQQAAPQNMPYVQQNNTQQ